MDHNRFMKMGAVLLGAFISLNSGCPPRLDLEADEKLADTARNMPKEDILKDREVARKISSTGLYVSLTTSPARIGNLDMVLRTVDLSLVEKILLILPEKFRGESYVIPDHIRHFPKLKIIRTRTDRGPISKLIGSLELQNIYEGLEIANQVVANPDNFVLTIDDDTGYPNGTFSQLLKAGIQNKGAIAASAVELSNWNLDKKKGWPDLEVKEPKCGSDGLSRCDVVEGFGGVIYKVADALLAMPDMLQLVAASKSCYTSDDFVISFALAHNNIKRYQLANEFIQLPLQFSYGFGEDALHRGAGLDQEKSLTDMNAKKYGACFEVATKLFLRR